MDLEKKNQNNSKNYESSILEADSKDNRKLKKITLYKKGVYINNGYYIVEINIDQKYF